MVSIIRAQALFAVRHLFADVRDEAVQEILCTACVAYARLHREGRAHIASASSLARFAVRRYRSGRRVAEGTNVDEITSPACQVRRGVQRSSLSGENGVWDDLLTVSRRATPAEMVASKLDFVAFLDTLSARQRQIAATLATGETTQRTAEMFAVSPGRISQFRREFKTGWDRFVGNVETVVA